MTSNNAGGCKDLQATAQQRAKPVHNTTNKLPHFTAVVSTWRRRLVLLLWVVVIGVALDQGSKLLVQNSLARVLVVSSQNSSQLAANRPGPVYVPSRHIVLVPGLFELRYVENSAAAFSLTRSIPEWIRMPLLIGVSSVAIVFFLWWYLTLQPASWWLLLAFCMVVAGAIGNLIDRARLGYVIDFLHFYAGFAGYPEVYWPTFNVADSLIVVGAIGILLHTFLADRAAAAQRASSCRKQQPERAAAS